MWQEPDGTFYACTSIKVAVLLSKITDLPQEHSLLLTPSFTVGSFLRLPCCCNWDLFSLPAGPGRWHPNRDLIGLHGCSRPKREYGFFRAERVFSQEYKQWVKVVVGNFL